MDAADEGEALCIPFLLQLPVQGASIAVVSASGARSTVGTTDDVARRVDDLQFELGEGPIPDVMRHGLLVSALDLDADGVRAAWPVFAPASRALGVQALFAYPMVLGGTRVGVVTLYALVVQRLWSSTLMRRGAALAAAAAAPAVELATRSALAEQGDVRQRTELRREVHHAAGMLMVQLQCGIDEAMARLRAHAFASGEPVDAVARAVVAGTLRIDGRDA